MAAARKAGRRPKGDGGICQRKDGRWQATLTVGRDANGKQIRRTVYGRTKEEARKKLDDLKQLHSQGSLPAASTTLMAFYSRWLAEKRRQVKARTVEFYARYMEHHVLPRLGGVKLERIGPMAVQDLLSGVAEEVSEDAANKCRTVLGAVLSQAVQWQLIGRNPVDAVSPYRVRRKSVELWTPDEVRRFLDTARDHRLYAAFYIALATGMRHGEILGLRWRDLADGSLYVRQAVIVLNHRAAISSPKTAGGERQVAISSDVLEVLEDHRRKQEAEGGQANELGLMFSSRTGTPLHPRNFDRAWYKLQEHAGVRRIRFHDLRHLHVSLLVRHGFDPQTIADRVGHADAAFTLRRYSHMFEEQRARAAVGLDLLLRDRNAEEETGQGR